MSHEMLLWLGAFHGVKIIFKMPSLSEKLDKVQALEGDFWTGKQSWGYFFFGRSASLLPIAFTKAVHAPELPDPPPTPRVKFKLCYWAYEIWPRYFLPLFPLPATTLSSLEPFLRNYPLSCFKDFAESSSSIYYVPSILTPSHLQVGSYLSELTLSVTSSRKPSLTTPIPKTRSADPPICFHSILNFIRAPNPWYYKHLPFTCHLF